MHIFDAALLGIVEGITEFLPISSTGHMILASQLLHVTQNELLKNFEIIIQLGAICAVVVLYWRSFLNIEILKRLIVGFIPTGIIGLALYKIVKTYFLGNDYLVLTMLVLGGIALIAFEYFHREQDTATRESENITYRQALGIGLFQSLAVVPGISRSAATIIGGMLLGLSRPAIVEFSFLLAVPTLGAATALDLLKSYSTFSANDIRVLAVGFIAAFLSALFVIRLLLQYVRTRTFIPFGIYRIVAAILFWLIILR